MAHYVRKNSKAMRHALCAMRKGEKMFKNYIKIILRNLARQKGYALINILGLAIGIACFILIALWVFDELSYDQFHEKKQRIFRVNTISSDFGIVTSSSWRLGPTMKDAYPEVESYTRVWPWARSLVKYEDKIFDEWNIYLADSSFFSIFTFPFIKGEPKTALAERYSVVITEATAERYFGSEEPLGKMVYSRAFDRNFKVTGVIKNVPKNSSMQFDIVARVDLMPHNQSHGII